MCRAVVRQWVLQTLSQKIAQVKCNDTSSLRWRRQHRGDLLCSPLAGWRPNTQFNQQSEEFGERPPQPRRDRKEGLDLSDASLFQFVRLLVSGRPRLGGGAVLALHPPSPC